MHASSAAATPISIGRSCLGACPASSPSMSTRCDRFAQRGEGTLTVGERKRLQPLAEPNVDKTATDLAVGDDLVGGRRTADRYGRGLAVAGHGDGAGAAGHQIHVLGAVVQLDGR